MASVICCLYADRLVFVFQVNRRLMCINVNMRPSFWRGLPQVWTELIHNRRQIQFCHLSRGKLFYEQRMLCRLCGFPVAMVRYIYKANCATDVCTSACTTGLAVKPTSPLRMRCRRQNDFVCSRIIRLLSMPTLNIPLCTR